MADALLGSYRFDPLLNEYVGEVSDATTTQGQDIKILKPIYIEFEENENFTNALDILGKFNVTGDTVISGNTDIGNKLNVGGNLDIIGLTTAEGYSTLSDRRFKENIFKLSSDTGISNVNVYKYNLKGNDKKTFGVIAQELLTTPGFEHMVNRRDDDFLSVDYTQFIPVLISEVKQLKKRMFYLGTSLVAFGFIKYILYR